ncbi:MAG: hypothetical protein KBF93_04150 [Leptospiraceae bacterium]|nr:hypothetical protein [Leptospiraceae bacterium]
MPQILEETIRELGFKSLEDFLSLKVIEELEKKIQCFQKEISELEKKYGMTFPTFKATYLTSQSEEDFIKSDDGAEWEWNLFAIESSRKKIETIKNARNH